ncbi:MAG: hypothetical protein P1U61_04760 [Legionellaceae bacterium]|nr:hypothetical protein [Legionellaceae bacterium]
MWTLFGVTFLSEDEKKQLKKMYLTQQDMIRAGGIRVNGRGNGGLCQPLASTWLEGQMDGTGSEYLKDKYVTLDRTLAVNEAQRQMRDAGEDYESYAFLKTKTPYIKKDVPVVQLTTPESLNTVLGSHEYALFSYPTRDAGPYHAVAFSDTSKKDEKCRFFDADRPGGQASGPCDAIKRLMAASLKRSAEREDNPVASLTLSTPSR